MNAPREFRVPGAPYAVGARQFASEIGSFLFQPADQQFPIERLFALFPINIIDKSLERAVKGRGSFVKADGGNRIFNVGDDALEVPFKDESLGVLSVTFPAEFSAGVTNSEAFCRLGFDSRDLSKCITVALAAPPPEYGFESTQILRGIVFSHDDIRYEFQNGSNASLETTDVIVIVDFNLEFDGGPEDGDKHDSKALTGDQYRYLGIGPSGCWWLCSDGDGKPVPPKDGERCDANACYTTDCLTFQEASDQAGVIVHTGWWTRDIFRFGPDPTNLLGKTARLTNSGQCPYEITPGPGGRPVYYLPAGERVYITITSFTRGINHLYNSSISGFLTRR